MGLKYIWDTNSVVHYFNKLFPPAGEKFIDDILTIYKPVISVITEIELSCWKTASGNDLFILKKFIDDSLIYGLDENIKLKTIEIRRRFNLKLPDAIIAATAVVTDLTLISNDAGFNRVSSLKLVNPFKAV